MHKQAGQAILESLVVFGILMFSTFAVIEVARLLAFKANLQAIANDVALQISLRHLDLKRTNVIENINKQDATEEVQIFKADLKKKIRDALEFTSNYDVSLIKHNFRFYVHFLDKKDIRKETDPNGIYLKINTHS